MNFIEELKWRGLYHQEIPGTEEYLTKNTGVRGYIGFDPTASSLGIGNLVQIIILKHFQRAGHQPIAVLGGATGMIGDPSGKSAERNLQTKEQLEINKQAVAKQIKHFLDTDPDQPLIFVDNYDFYKDMGVLDFLRDVGKHLTVNYMMAKDSVKSRLDTGISYTEFTYQLIQGYDFYKLQKDYNCVLQLGGSDQWGNLTTGVELIRRMGGGEAFAATSPLVTKADGTKFGKTEKGNVFLSADLTSPYQFYQFWMNVSDEDAENFIKIFTFLSKEEIETLIAQHKEAPHQRALQKRLAEEITVWVHSREEYETAVKASEILFGRGTSETLRSLSNRDLLSVFEGVPQFALDKAAIADGLGVLDLLAEATQVFASKGEVRRAIKGNALAINNEKVIADDATVNAADLLNDKILWVRNGKKNNYLILVD